MTTMNMINTNTAKRAQQGGLLVLWISFNIGPIKMATMILMFKETHRSSLCWAVVLSNSDYDKTNF